MREYGLYVKGKEEGFFMHKEELVNTYADKIKGAKEILFIRRLRKVGYRAV